MNAWVNFLTGLTPVHYTVFIIGLLLCMAVIYIFHKKYRNHEDQQISKGYWESIIELIDDLNNILYLVENKRHAFSLYTGKTYDKTIKASNILDKISQKVKSAQKILNEGESLIKANKSLKKVEEDIISAESIIEDINNNFLREVDSIQSDLQQTESRNSEKLNFIQYEIDNIYKNPHSGNTANMINDLKIALGSVKQKQVEGDVFTANLMLQEIENVLLEFNSVNSDSKESTNFASFVKTDFETSDDEFKEKLSKITTEDASHYVKEQTEEHFEQTESIKKESEDGIGTNLSDIAASLEQVEEPSTDKIPLINEVQQPEIPRIEINPHIDDDFSSIIDSEFKEFIECKEPEEPKTEELVIDQTDSLIGEGETPEDEYEQLIETLLSKELEVEIPVSREKRDRSLLGDLEMAKKEIEKSKHLANKMMSISRDNIINDQLIIANIDEDKLKELNDERLINFTKELNNVKKEIESISQNEYPSLVKYFSSSSWNDVSTNLINAGKLMSGAGNLIEAAGELNSPDSRKFYRADINLQRAEQKLTNARNLCKELKSKLQNLVDSRKKDKIYLNELIKKFKSLHDGIAQNTVDLKYKDMIMDMGPSIKILKDEFNLEHTYDYSKTEDILNNLGKSMENILSKIKSDEN